MITQKSRDKGPLTGRRLQFDCYDEVFLLIILKHIRLIELRISRIEEYIKIYVVFLLEVLCHVLLILKDMFE